MNDLVAAQKYGRLRYLARTTVVLIALAACTLFLHAWNIINTPVLFAYSSGALVLLIFVSFILELLMRPLRNKLKIIESQGSASSGESWIVDPVYGPPDHH